MTETLTMASAGARQPPFVLLLVLAWLLAAVQLVAGGWAATTFTLPDADDAMRLVQLRDWLGGQGWFDLHQARLAPPAGYDSHWSRLIDAGLAGLLWLFGRFTDVAMAERLMLTVWPMLWLLPTMAGAAAIAWRIAGREAALIVLLLAVFGMPGFQQFRPGRIDHHNIHIALSMLVVAAAAWSDRARWTAWAAGALSGLAFAIGFESLPFVFVAAVAFVARFVFDRDAAASLFAFAFAMCASTFAAFMVSVGPDRWAQSVCDGIAVNSTVAVVIGTFGLTLAATSFASDDWRGRAAAVAIAVAPALAVFALFEPSCLRGPYALVDPAVGPVWLDHVAEVQTLARMVRESIVTGAATLAFPAFAVVAVVILAMQPARRRDYGFLVAAGAGLLACGMTAVVVKAFSYAMWFGLPLVAAALASVFASLRVTGLVPRFAAALVLTPTAVTIGAMTLAQAAGSAPPLVLDTPERQACTRRDSAAALAQLPAGVIVTNELEWGPYLLAWTPHSVLAAPYHRLSSTIVTAHHALSKPPDEARRTVARAGIDMIVLCGSRGPLGLDEAATAASLWGRLRAGDTPPWLERVMLPDNQPFVVYRVLRRPA